MASRLLMMLPLCFPARQRRRFLYICAGLIYLATLLAGCHNSLPSPENPSPPPSPADGLTGTPADTANEAAPTATATPLPTATPEPSYAPDELVLTLYNESGETLDSLVLTIDGVLPKRPLDAVYNAGRICFDGEMTASAFSAELSAETEDSLFAFCERNALSADFHWEQGSVSLYTGYRRPEQHSPSGTKDALLRLEDIAAYGPPYYNPDELFKLRVMADLLWERGAAFSIAWVPYYVRPADDYANDVTSEYNRSNCEFVFTIDYMISRGGVLGLHGYSHQHGKENSVAGYEFGPGINDSEEATRTRIEMALNAAAALDWTAHFFEFPHYASTEKQSLILEEYFDVIYTRPYKKWPGKPYYVQNGERTVVYLHTPQDYLHSAAEADVAKMVGQIQNAGAFCSLFFHPYLDYNSITVSRDGLHPPVVDYSSDSPLHRILDAFASAGRIARSPMYYVMP